MDLQTDWIDMISRVYNRNGPIIYNKFNYKIIPLREIISLPFNQEITILIIERKVYAWCDASVKESRMCEY